MASRLARKLLRRFRQIDKLDGLYAAVRRGWSRQLWFGFARFVCELQHLSANGISIQRKAIF